MEPTNLSEQDINPLDVFFTPEGIESPLHNNLAAYFMEKKILEDRFVSKDELKQTFRLSEERFWEIYPKFKKSLEIRGWDCPAYQKTAGPVVKKHLDPFFCVAVELLLDIADKRSKTAKFKAAGISSIKFNKLLDDEKHRKYWLKQLEAAKAKAATSADLSLMRNVEAGDLQSIKYFNDFTGRFTEGESVTLNFIALISKIMEVLAKHVDPAVLTAVADEIEVDIIQGELTSGS